MNLQTQGNCVCGVWDCSKCYIPPANNHKTAVAVTIYKRDAEGCFTEAENYDVLGVTESGSRGKEYQLGHKEDGLIHRVCHMPRFRIRSALTSGQRIVYHY